MDIIKEIKSKVSMHDVLKIYGYKPVKGTSAYCCMYHEDTNPSVHIMKNGCKFHCFSCGITKDIFDFVQDQEKCNIRTAIRILDNKFELGICGNLTEQQKLEINQNQENIQKFRKEMQLWEEFKKETCIKILDKIKIWKQIEDDCCLTYTDFSNDDWQLAELYFYAIKQQEKLSCLYDILNGHFESDSNQVYFLGDNQENVLNKIAKGEIII